MSRFEFIEEFKLGADNKEQIQNLLVSCFKEEEFKERIYYKQRAHYRLLLWQGKKLIGQLGLDYRVMRLGEKPIQVLGVIDFAIDPNHQGKGLGSKILNELDHVALQYKDNIDIILLMADKPNVYKRNGYQSKSQKLLWWGIHNHQNVDKREDLLSDGLMIKLVNLREWDDAASLDMLGYMY
ncbi:MAG: GNAT superfamily N-acetyltransferase [Chitinophagales bacterium]|jgi:GNAT superfamily N-acetyltransferase